MTMKMECENCKSQVAGEGMGPHGWLSIGQFLAFRQFDQAPVTGNFCTESCLSEWLTKRAPKVEAKEDLVQKAQDDLVRAHNRANVVGEMPSDPKSAGVIGGKAGRILAAAAQRGEPVFVFRAKDLLATFALEAYAEALHKFGAPLEHQEGVANQRDAFREWQQDHPDMVRLPD